MKRKTNAISFQQCSASIKFITLLSFGYCYSFVPITVAWPFNPLAHIILVPPRKMTVDTIQKRKWKRKTATDFFARFSFSSEFCRLFPKRSNGITQRYVFNIGSSHSLPFKYGSLAKQYSQPNIIIQKNERKMYNIFSFIPFFSVSISCCCCVGRCCCFNECNIAVTYIRAVLITANITSKRTHTQKEGKREEKKSLSQ